MTKIQRKSVLCRGCWGTGTASVFNWTEEQQVKWSNHRQPFLVGDPFIPEISPNSMKWRNNGHTIEEEYLFTTALGGKVAYRGNLIKCNPKNRVWRSRGRNTAVSAAHDGAINRPWRGGGWWCHCWCLSVSENDFAGILLFCANWSWPTKGLNAK